LVGVVELHGDEAEGGRGVGGVLKTLED